MEVRQSSGQRLSGEQLQSSQVQLSHSQSGLLQLVAYGAQDVYLTGNPQVTFWKVVYRRCTNFAMESIEQTFSGVADFGSKVECNIARKGDLIGRMYLVADLPALAVQVSGSATNTQSGKVRLTFKYTNLTAGMQSRSGTNKQPDYSAAQGRAPRQTPYRLIPLPVYSNIPH